MTLPNMVIPAKVPLGPDAEAAPEAAAEPDAVGDVVAVASMMVRDANELPKSVVSEIVRADTGLIATKVRAVDLSNNALNLFINKNPILDC